MADTSDRQRELVKAIVADSQELDVLMNETPPPSQPPTPPISTMDAFDRALSEATAGATILLATSLVYKAPLKITKPGITLMSETTAANAGVRITADEPAPKFLGGLTIAADHVTCSGMDVRHTNPLTDIVALNGRHLTLDRMRVLGSTVEGAKRGVAANGGDMLIRNGYIDEIKRPGVDTQAICAWDMLEPGLIIDNMYLAGSAQAVMLGGGDPRDAASTPSMVRIGRSILAKPTGWRTDGSQVKCAFEAKNCHDVQIMDCDLEGAGTSAGQGAYAIVLTPRNQDGHAEYSAVMNVKIMNCRVKSAGGCVSFLGTDPTPGKPSQWLDGVTITNVVFSDIDPKVYGGPGRLFTFEDGARNVTLDSLTINGTNIAASAYFMKRPPVKLVLRNLKLPASKYGLKIDAGGSGIAALQAYAPDAVIELSQTDTGAQLKP